MNMSDKAYWAMVQGDMGCSECKKYKGDRHSIPCDGYHGIDVDEEEGVCPEKEEV